MKSYSQNNEDIIICEYFKSFKGTLLSIGENDGITLSNVYNLLLRDWAGVLVEPSKEAFRKLKINTKVLDVELHNVAISDKAGELEFYESGTHLGKGDTSLLSTLNESELERWKGSNNHFIKTTCEAITYQMLLERSKYKSFDFISVDCEGKDLDVLKQIDLSNTKMVCIEYNNNPIVKNQIIEYCSKFGLDKIFLTNYENIILCR